MNWYKVFQRTHLPKNLKILIFLKGIENISRLLNFGSNFSSLCPVFKHFFIARASFMFACRKTIESVGVENIFWYIIDWLDPRSSFHWKIHRNDGCKSFSLDPSYIVALFHPMVNRYPQNTNQRRIFIWIWRNVGRDGAAGGGELVTLVYSYLALPRHMLSTSSTVKISEHNVGVGEPGYHGICLHCAFHCCVLCGLKISEHNVLFTTVVYIPTPRSISLQSLTLQFNGIPINGWYGAVYILISLWNLFCITALV